MSELAIYAGLFITAFGAATILPLQSELVVAALLLNGSHPWEIVILVASLGNILGSIVNWLIGRSFTLCQGKWWFPATQEGMRRAEGWYHRYGRVTLLLSWVPFIGDPLTIIAGMLREPLWSFTLLVGVAKIARYLVLTAITLSWIS